ncbi:hypothetical protein [Chroococcidiopsis sp.]|uniref:hypothetical protein n=1 Tax=Chroococcidiopsis sp. TaxID=3088168 RepID=UPI003F39302E
MLISYQREALWGIKGAGAGSREQGKERVAELRELRELRERIDSPHPTPHTPHPTPHTLHPTPDSRLPKSLTRSENRAATECILPGLEKNHPFVAMLLTVEKLLMPC